MNKREITVAANAGFCFGVKRATDRLEEALKAAVPGERIYTLGHLIHNEVYNESLRRRGVEAIDTEDIGRVASEASEAKETVRELTESARQNPYFDWIDCTCPYVKKIHKIAGECNPEEQFFVLIGAENHPEVKGIMSCFEGEKYVFSTAEELESSLSQQLIDKVHKKTPVMVAQTTQKLTEWKKTEEIIDFCIKNGVNYFDTAWFYHEGKSEEIIGKMLKNK